MKYIETICNVVGLACILSAIVIGLLGIWTEIASGMLWRSFLTGGLLFGGCAALVGIATANRKLGRRFWGDA